MFTNRKRDRFTSVLLLPALRRRAHVYTSPYHLSAVEQHATLTPETILRHRRALRRSRRRHLRARRSAAAELTRLSNRRTFLDTLCHILLHPTSLLRLPFTLLRRARFLCRNKKRRHLLRRPATQPQPS